MLDVTQIRAKLLPIISEPPNPTESSLTSKGAAPKAKSKAIANIADRQEARNSFGMTTVVSAKRATWNAVPQIRNKASRALAGATPGARAKSPVGILRIKSQVR